MIDKPDVMAPSALRLIPLQDILPSKHQARKDFDDEALKGLADSMKAEGLIEPIVVRPEGPESRVYELISGERRLRAAKLLGWKTIEAKVLDVADESEAAVKGLIENLQREDLNPIEEAEGLKQLQELDSKWRSQVALAKAVGKNRTYISQSLSFLELPESVRENVRYRTFGRSHAIELLRINDRNLQISIAGQISKNGLSVEAVRGLVNDALAGKLDAKAIKAMAKREPPVDPLAAGWEKLAQDRTLDPSSWKVKYNSNGWTLWISSHSPYTHAVMGFLARALTNVFEPTARQVDETIAKTEAAALQEVEKQIPGITEAVKAAPDQETVEREALAEREEFRLPETEEEWRQLEAEAEKSVEAAYAWIAGWKHEVTRTMKGKTWVGIGFAPTAKESIHRIVEAMRVLINAKKEGLEGFETGQTP